MHRLPRVFIHKKSVDSKRGKRGVSTVSPVNPKPKLERLNARKNFDYDSSASIDDFTEELTGKNSFRIDGNQGEFLEFFQKLGFSGSDDFSIPADEWDAMMSRSSSEVDVSRSQQLDPLVSSKLEFSNNHVIDVSSSRNCGDGGGSGTSHKIDADIYICSDSTIVSDAIQLRIRSPELINDSSSDVVCKDVIRLEDGVTKKGAVLNGKGHVSLVGGGINGVRPPLLAPPPAMSLPIVDEACSTWDIFRAFYSDDHTESGLVGREIYRSEVISGDEEGVNNEEDDEDNNRRRMAGLLSESCSFTASSNDDDSSSTTTEPMSIISPNGRFTRVITYWEKGGLLGRGSFGSVYEGISDYGFFFAVKEVSLLDQGKEGRQSLHQLEQEIELLSQFKHENIVQYYGTDTDDSKLYIFLELVTQGSLLSLYQKYNLQDSQVSSYTRQILHGLKYLHDQNVVHRDIKCANILVHVNGSVKLADFGLAKATKANDVKSCKGTALWMAPEVVNRKGQGYGLAADIWSLGCTVLEMLTRQFPYSHLECQMQALFRIGKGEPPPVPDTLSVEARDFIYMCLQVDPSARPTASQLLEHPFVKRTLASASGSGSPHNLGRRL